MSFPELLNEVELKFKNRLEDYFSLIFKDIIIPSHDLTHHRRVWIYAKELLQSLNKHCINTHKDITEKLIIGCYLHDSGMAICSGKKHGYHSMLFCRSFLDENNLDPELFKDLLSVVENHDDKEYFNKGKAVDLFTILSVSDDLDAFGITGIYRYSEIYLSRGINIKELGSLILENVAKRYQYFNNSFSFDKELLEKHTIRYNMVVDFFSEFNQTSKSGNFGVIEVIDETIRNKTYSINDIISNGLKTNDKSIVDFFRKLAQEI
jgi:hypothetical protein